MTILPTPPNTGPLRRLLRDYLRPHWPRVGVAMVCMVLTSVCMGLFVHLIQPLIDDVLKPHANGMVYTLPLAIAGLFLIKGSAEFTQSYLLERTGLWITAQMQKDMHRRLIYQDLAYFLQNPPAALTSRFLFDMQRLRQSLSMLIAGGLRDVAMVIAMTANLFAKDWRMALASFILLPMVLLPVKKIGRKMRHYARRIQENSGDFSAVLSEGLVANRMIKTFTMEEREIARTNLAIDGLRRNMLKSATLYAMTSPLVEFIGMCFFAAVIFYAATQVQAGELTAGAFTSFLTSLLLVYRPIKGLSNLNNVVQDASTSAERAFALIDCKPLIVDAPDAKPFAIEKADIHFSKLVYNYPDGTPALKGIDLRIPAGRTVAVVGPSGAGKSTLLNLIPRFFDPTSGQMLINGTDVKTVKLHDLRQHVALVSQDVALLNDTVGNNIAFGREGATQDEIIAAAKDAAAHEFILALDNGYDTMVGENGQKLSGGQRQRIAIARALLNNAPILLLDEATSSLDTQSERLVQQALQKLMAGRTTLVVAHRLSTVVNADEIYVLQAGQIREHGTHAELLAQGGLYAELYNMQAAG